MQIHTNDHLQHNALMEGHFLDKNGGPIIIDLQCSTPHECERKMRVVVGGVEPWKHEFDCEEVYDFAILLELWFPCECFCHQVQTSLAN